MDATFVDEPLGFAVTDKSHEIHAGIEVDAADKELHFEIELEPGVSDDMKFRGTIPLNLPH